MHGLRIIRLAHARVVTGFAADADMPTDSIDPQLWGVDEVDLDNACDLVLTLHDLLDLEPSILPPTDARQHRAWHPDFSGAVLIYFDIHLIIERHILVSDDIAPGAIAVAVAETAICVGLSIGASRTKANEIERVGMGGCDTEPNCHSQGEPFHDCDSPMSHRMFRRISGCWQYAGAMSGGVGHIGCSAAPLVSPMPAGQFTCLADV